MLTKYLSFQRLWRYVAVYLFYLAIAILITYPLVTVLSTQFAGDNSGDAYEYARHIWWYRHALQTGQPLFYQSLFAYPDGMPSMYLWAVPLRTFPAWLFAFFMPLPAAFNLMLLLRLALNGAAMCWTAYQFTRNRGAALVAGAIFLAFPAMQGHLLGGHVDLLALWAVPLYVWSLFNLTPRTREYLAVQPVMHLYRAVAFAVLFFVVSLLGNFVLLIYTLFPITALFVLWRLFARDWRTVIFTIVTSIIGGSIALIFVLPAVLELISMPALHEGGSVRYSADFLALVSPSFFNPLYQNLGYNRQVLGINLIEGSGYLGIIAFVLACIGVWRAKAARWWLALAVVAWIFSLGPLLNINGAPLIVTVGGEYQTYIPLPWALFQSLPILDISRTPGRFNFVVGLCMAIMAAYGAANFPALTKRLNNRYLPKLALVVLLALILFDYQSFFPLPTITADIPAPIADLAQRDDVRAVFNVPWENLLAAKEALYLQTAHELPLIAGQVTRQTPVDPAMLTILQETLDPALLRQAGADVVIVQRAGIYDADGALFNRAQQQLGAPTYIDDRFAVFDVPTSGALPSIVVYPPLGYAAHFDPEITYYLYTSQAGWYLAGMEYDNVQGIDAIVSLNGQNFTSLTSQAGLLSGEAIIASPLPLVDAGYYTVDLSLVTPCLNQVSLSQVCDTRYITMTSGVQGFERAPYFQVDNFDEQVIFEHGVTLSGAFVHEDSFGSNVFLWWHFDETVADTNIRFVHVLNENGERVAGSDNALGILAAGSDRSELISLSTNDSLPSGEYSVYVGWYSYPDLVRFPILSGGTDQRAQDGLAYIGSFTVEAP